MTLIAFAGAVWALCFLATAIAEEKMFSTAANGVLETPKTLAQEIAAIEAQIDAIQEAAVAGIPSLLPGSPQRLQALGKLLFFDKELSVNRNEACAFCHMPQTGYQGAFESLNVSSVAMPGSVRTRFALRKPPSAAYAAFSPPLYYAEKPGEGKCSQCFIGGNFWDLRATGLRLHSPTAMQAHGSPLQFGAIQSAAPSLRMEASPVNVRDVGEIERDLTAFAHSANGGVIVALHVLSLLASRLTCSHLSIKIAVAVMP